MVTGKDASYNYMRMELFPEIRVNPAIQIRGAYQIGGNFNDPAASATRRAATFDGA